MANMIMRITGKVYNLNIVNVYGVEGTRAVGNERDALTDMSS